MATQLMTLNNQFHNNILDVGDRVMWNCCFLFMSVIYVNHRISLIYHLDEIFLNGLLHIWSFIRNTFDELQDNAVKF